MAEYLNNGNNLVASATGPSAYPLVLPSGIAPDGNGIIAGDLIIVNGVSDGTHVLNGQSVKDSVNNVNFTTIAEQQEGSGSTHYQQSFYYAAAANVPATSSITYTPFAAAANTAFCVDVFRFALGTIIQAEVGQANVSTATPGVPALGAAPPIGSLVLAFITFDSGTVVAPPAGFTLASNGPGTGGAQVATAYCAADGVSTYSGLTWTLSAPSVSATQIVAFKNAGVGVPYKVGSQSDAAGQLTTTVTVGSNSGRATTLGDALIVVAATQGGSTVVPTSVTDSKSHTYTLIRQLVAPNGTNHYVFQSLNASALVAGGSPDTVVVHWNATSYAKQVGVYACAGINQTTALDQVGPDTYGDGATPSVTTPPLSNNNELALGIVTGGYKCGGINWPDTTWTELDEIFSTGTVHLSVAYKVIQNSTAPVVAAPTLQAPAIFAASCITLVPDPPAGAAATLTFVTPSPLNQWTDGQANSEQIVVTGGSQPYLFAVTGGALPSGVTVSPGQKGGTNGPIKYIGLHVATATLGQENTQGIFPTLAAWKFAQNTFGGTGGHGPIKIIKLFNSNAFPATWAACIDGTQNPAKTITDWDPGTAIIMSYSVPQSAQTLQNFMASVPTSQVLYMNYNSEPEHSGESSSSFLAQSHVLAQAVHSFNNPNWKTCTSSYQPYYTSTSVSKAFLPPPQDVDVYGMDIYEREKSVWPSNGLATTGWFFQNWLSLVLPFGKPLGLTEWGLANSLNDPVMRANRLQQDITYLQNNWGTSGSVQKLQFEYVMYWWRNMNNPPATDNQFVDAQAIGIYTSALKSQGGGSGSSGGLVNGTTTAAPGTFNFTVQVTDANGATNSKAYALPVVAPGTSLAISNTALPGATQTVPYGVTGVQLQATGGTGSGYTWSLNAGSGPLPTGISIAGSQLVGTPTATAGSYPIVLKVTDSGSNVATASLTIVVAAPPQIVTATLPNGVVLQNYSAVVSATFGTAPLDYTATGLDATGLVIDPTLGSISGTPTTAGAFPITITVTDQNGAQTSATFTLTIAPSGQGGGGLPDIGRRVFGGGNADFVYRFSGDTLVRAAGTQVQYYNSIVPGGGVQYTDLLDMNNTPITFVTTDNNGFPPQFQGPSGVLAMYEDANGGNGPRRLVYATDIDSLLVTLHDFLKTVTG